MMITTFSVLLFSLLYWFWLWFCCLFWDEKQHQTTMYNSTPTAMLRCMDCGDFFTMSNVVKYGAKHKCRPCHCSYRFVRDNNPRWSQMNGEQRRKAIVANRSEGQRGKARKLTTDHKVRVYGAVWTWLYAEFQSLFAFGRVVLW